MNKILLKFLLLINSCGLLHIATLFDELSAQVSLVSETNLPDSLYTDGWDEETYYNINILRLQRWIKDNLKVLDDAEISGQVARLLKEAKGFAESGDHYLANMWLETVWELLNPAELQTSDEVHEETKSNVAENASNFQWSKEIISGVDLWRQEFSFTILQQDSTYTESSGNPFSGFRLHLDYESKNKAAFQGQTFFKYSRDYVSGEAEANFAWFVAPYAKWKLEDRFEGTSFYRDFHLKYLQNSSSLSFITSFDPVTFEVEDELLIRRYADSDSSYPNYFANTLRFNSRLSWNIGSWLELGFQNVIRNHNVYNLYDYKENRFELSWTQRAGEVLNFTLENELRLRDYENVPADYFFQDYWEDYFWGDFELNFTSKFGTTVTSTLTKREYEFFSANSLPDFLYWEVEPELFFKLGSEWEFGFGFHYGAETYQKLEDEVNRSPTAATDAASAVYSIQFEDFYEYGPMVTFDFLKINNLIFSLKETFLFRRYLNSLNQNTQEFNLYTDRNTNSLLLFITWNLSKKWQLNILANMDDDRSQKDDSGDSQNTLIDFEISYSF